jgi:branched-subunit amino acid transport protein
MPFLAVAALAAITYTFRIAGPLLTGRVTVPDSAQRLFASAAAVLLVALAATSALTTGHDFAGWARPAGVLVAGVLAARRVPFPIVVLAAASVTALLRLAGIHLSRTAGADSRSCTRPREGSRRPSANARPQACRSCGLAGPGPTTPLVFFPSLYRF